MRIGFTGTRDGMSRRQLQAAYKILIGIDKIELYHGGCQGADLDIERLLLLAERVPAITCYPGDETQFKAAIQRRGEQIDSGMVELYEVHAPMPYLARNKKIVHESEIMIAAPATLHEQQRSGTWATIRYARKVGKPLIILEV